MTKYVLLFVLLCAAPVAAQPTDKIAESLRAERAKYAATIDKADAAKILNTVAWNNRADGWVLLGKSAGNHCPQPTTGVAISCDFLVNAMTKRGWDVLIAAPDDDTPLSSAAVNCCGGSGEDLAEAVTTGRRTLVAAVDPGAGPVITPPVDPPVVVTPPVSALEPRIVALEAQVQALAGQLAGLSAGTDAGIKNLEGRINTLAARPVPVSCIASVWGYSVQCRLQ